MIKHIPWKQMLASWVGPMRLVEVLTEVLQAILQAGSARWSDRPAPCWAESVIVGRMYRGEGSPTWFTIWVDTGSTRDVRDATKRVIYDFDASSQVDAISSGGAIISALLSRWGRAANPDDIVQAARWMKNKGLIHTIYGVVEGRVFSRRISFHYLKAQNNN